MRGYMLRGQGHGIFTDKVYTSYPTDEHFKAALAQELERHGVEFGQIEGDEAEITATARERWIRVVECEIVGLEDVHGRNAEDESNRRFDMTGMLEQSDLERILEDAKKGPPGTMVSGVGLVAAAGTGTVVNPGDRESMTVGPGDVGKIKASDLK